MGAGLALEIKMKYPYYYVDYQALCRRGALRIGTIGTYDLGEDHQPHRIVSFPTKDHWRDRSTLETIERGLDALRTEMVNYGAYCGQDSLAVPALGCGLGGLSWPSVSRLMEQYLSDIENIDVVAFRPVN